MEYLSILVVHIVGHRLPTGSLLGPICMTVADLLPKGKDNFMGNPYKF